MAPINSKGTSGLLHRANLATDREGPVPSIHGEAAPESRGPTVGSLSLNKSSWSQQNHRRIQEQTSRTGVSTGWTVSQNHQNRESDRPGRLLNMSHKHLVVWQMFLFSSRTETSV